MLAETEQVSFEIGFVGGVGVDRTKIRREGRENKHVFSCRLNDSRAY